VMLLGALASLLSECPHILSDSGLFP
jgi:hypothetical protein